MFILDGDHDILLLNELRPYSLDTNDSDNSDDNNNDDSSSATIIDIEYKNDRYYKNHFDTKKICTLTRDSNDVEPVVGNSSSSNDSNHYPNESTAGEDEVLIFEHEARASRLDANNSYRKRGLGTLRLYFHKKLKILRLEFIDPSWKKIRLHQTFYPYFDFKMTYNESDETIIWTNTDYVMDRPVTASWKIVFVSNSNSNSNQSQRQENQSTTSSREGLEVARVEFSNIVKDFYLGQGLPRWCEHNNNLPRNSSKPWDYGKISSPVQNAVIHVAINE